MLNLDPKTTALVVIDLQKGIVSRQTASHSTDQVVERAKRLAETFRKAGSPVVMVHVGFAKDFRDAPSQNVDQPSLTSPGSVPPDFSDFVEGLVQEGDLIIKKHQWGAFHGTELDLQLRRRHIRTIVLAGIATNIGVESTARDAWELGYDLVLAEDVTAAFTAELHAFALKNIFPRISKVVQSDELSLNTHGRAA